MDLNYPPSLCTIGPEFGIDRLPTVGLLESGEPRMRKLLLVTTLLALVSLSSRGYAANLLSNPGFEQAFWGWSNSGAAIRTSNPSAYEGTKYIFGPNTSQFSVWQEVTLADHGYLEQTIDTGLLTAEFGGWQSGYMDGAGIVDKDNGRILVELLDNNGGVLDTAATAEFYRLDNIWEERSDSIALLAGTRSIRFEYLGIRVRGSNNDAYFDAAYLNIAPVPLPGAFWLFAPAIAGLGVFLRRKPAA